MVRKRLCNQKSQKSHRYLPAIILVVSVFSISIVFALTNAPRIYAFEGTSTQTSCIDDQPCLTTVCNEGQPYKVSETSNSDYEFETEDKTNIFLLPSEDIGTMGLMPFSDPYNDDYLDDQEEYFEEQQDMLEDAEFE